ncbi:class I SAM-dependent methyltransferase [Dehalobacterium formicoaceticum]|uniref:class I SAM-dependent methyltransferase n=1 Tax=Dehalobacterium formicoaceticum TaxID=51515 RepID=UPI001FA8D519|nr:class I SAM-dependent methyltransferase [Dehalobacterium formicoaceticum]
MVIIKNQTVKSAVEWSHQFLAQVLGPGSLVIDATAGNGRDTLFLAGLVGRSGKVYAFDIQEEAIMKTRKLLDDAGMEKQVCLFHQSHERMDEVIGEKVDAILFNLGYLPGGDTRIITTAGTTLGALKKAALLLKDYGLLVLVVYWGHPGGPAERDAVEGWAADLSPKEWDVMKISFPNHHLAPFVMIMQKKSGEASIQ